MTKVVYNNCFGGFGLSKKAQELYRDFSGKDFVEFECPRHDPNLVMVVEQLGELANDEFGYSKLKIAEIEGNKYLIKEYDGNEKVIEPKDLKWIEV